MYEQQRVSPIKSLVIDELVYIPIGEYKPMFIRPYTARVQESALDNIVNSILSSRSPVVSTDTLIGLNTGLIYPSSVPLQSNIDASWVGEKRFIFMLKVTTVDHFGIIYRSYLQGYTNYNGITVNGVADHELVHTVNTIIETAVVNYNTPFGQGTKEKLFKVYNVINNVAYSNNCYLQRPSDIFYNMEINNITNSLNQMSDFQGIGSNEDTRYTVSANDVVNKTSDVNNSVPSQYVASIINNGLKSMANLDFQHTYDDHTLAAEAINKVNDPDIKNNQFLRYLSMQNRNRRYGMFSFGELCNIDSTINERFKVFNITKDIVDVTILNTPNVGEYWHGQDNTSVMAYSVIESSVSIATRYGFSKLYFTASNTLDATGAPYVIITYYNSFLNLDELEFNQLLELFKATFLSSVFLDESHNNAVPLTLNVYVDILGTSKVSIVEPNGYETWYTIPTFANSNFTPVLTVDKANLDHLSDNVTNIINYVSSQTQHNHM